MKAIMISIKPQYVEKILNGEKTIEIRKTMLKCELPCKVYIYCTKGKKLYKCVSNFDEDLLNGKVVAEFTLNKVDILERDLNDWLPKNRYEVSNELLKNINLNQNELWNYGQGKILYAWHIDDLKIYNKPKELSDFTRIIDYSSGFWHYCHREKVTRPPQSWMFVDNLEE